MLLLEINAVFILLINVDWWWCWWYGTKLEDDK